MKTMMSLDGTKIVRVSDEKASGLFEDPFGVINTISNLISNVGEQGIAGFISLAIIIILINKNK